ncbi:gag-pol polyprotein [Moniliophthora roreri MCA 2997]|uniref:Gag-pol polyprotein n=1 Tax=Moniliophthora roreri (strain MCA 2997) TaxID=1381753 RepID=V2WWV2_MONRO|nr:gag-pol polyprotein [Moniliophthora roreri MCA 2997]
MDNEVQIICKGLLHLELPKCHQGFSFAVIPAHRKTFDLKKLPGTYHEAYARPDSVKWKDAELEKLASLNQLEVFQEAELPAGAHTIGVQWVYKVNKHEEVIKYKAQLVTQDFSQ